MCMASMALAIAQQSGGPEVQLESAIHREVVMGDPKGALEQFRAVLAKPPVSRGTSARALYHVGQCLEKQGLRADARMAYSRVVREYADQEEAAALARARLTELESAIPGPMNLRFDQGQAGRLPPAWFVPALPDDVDRWAQISHTGCMSAPTCAVVMVPENSPMQMGNLMQSFSAKAYRGKAVRLRAWLRVEAGAPGDRAQMWLNIDRPNRQKGFMDNMSDRPVRSAEWTLCDIRARVDADATTIKFGVMSMGRGRVWVDNVTFETIAANEVK